MRKRSLGIIMLCMLLLTALPGKAAELQMTQATIKEADMSMMLPATCYLLGQNIAENDPYLQKVGGDREKIQNYYKEAGIVLNAIAEDDTYEIVVTMNESSNIDYVYNMQSLTEKQIREFADSIQTAYTSYGYQVDGYELYETQNAFYVLFRFGQLYEEQTVWCYQYYTIRDSRIYNITLRSYVGEITKPMETMIEQVVDSISYGKAGTLLTYQSEENGVQFSIADGWEKAVVKEEEPYIQAQYMHTSGLGESVQFFCMDLWGNMSSLHQLRNTRDDLTITAGDNKEKKKYKSYLSGFFKDYQETAFEKIGDHWYLTANEPLQVESESIEGVYLQKSVVTIQKGILYAFQYGYYEKGNLHEMDFQKCIQSVTYQNPKILLEDGQYYEEIAGMLYLVTGIAVLVGAALAGVIYMYVKESKEVTI